MAKLTPENATELENALDELAESRTGVPVLINDLMNPQRVPANFLPWLAWAFSVDDWSDTWSEEDKRSVIANSIRVHRLKGTVGSVRRAIAAAGYGDVTILEGGTANMHDASITHNGNETHGSDAFWANYSVYLNGPITNARAASLRAILASIAPVRCNLAALNFTEVAYGYDGTIRHDGAYNYGEA